MFMSYAQNSSRSFSFEYSEETNRNIVPILFRFVPKFCPKTVVINLDGKFR
jgi:hypothetical protein